MAHVQLHLVRPHAAEVALGAHVGRLGRVLGSFMPIKVCGEGEDTVAHIAHEWAHPCTSLLS